MSEPNCTPMSAAALTRGIGRISRSLYIAGLPQDSDEGCCPECSTALRSDVEADMVLCPDPDCRSGYIRSGGGWPA